MVGLVQELTTIDRESFKISSLLTTIMSDEPPAFPQEIVDTFIDFIQEDAQALAARGIVCRSWLPRSRYHLFKTVKFSLDLNLEFDGLSVCWSGSRCNSKGDRTA